MISFMDKLKSTVSRFLYTSSEQLEPVHDKLVPQKELLIPNQSFTEELIEKSPFKFEGTEEEKQRLINIYLSFSKTPEGEQQIKRLKSVFSTPIKLQFNSDLNKRNAAGIYYSLRHKIELNPFASQMDVTLRHETDHALDCVMPECREPFSIGQYFYFDKLSEIKAMANDVVMNFNHAHNPLDSLENFYEQQLAKARTSIPEGSNKEEQACVKAKGELIKLLWSGGTQLPDGKLKRNVLFWNEFYNQQAFKNARDKNLYFFKQMPDEDLKPFVQKVAKAMDIPVDVDFLIQQEHNGWKMLDGSLSFSNNKVLFCGKDKTICWQVTGNRLKYIETTQNYSKVSEFLQNTTLYEGKICPAFGTHLSKEHIRYSNGNEEILTFSSKKIGENQCLSEQRINYVDGSKRIITFDLDNQKNYMVQTVLPNQQELLPLVVRDSKPLDGVEVTVDDQNAKTFFKKYKNGQEIESLSFIAQNSFFVSQKDEKICFEKNKKGVFCITLEGAKPLLELKRKNDENKEGSQEIEQKNQEAIENCWGNLIKHYLTPYYSSFNEKSLQNQGVGNKQKSLKEFLKENEQISSVNQQLQNKQKSNEVNQPIFIKNLLEKKEK